MALSSEQKEMIFDEVINATEKGAKLIIAIGITAITLWWAQDKSKRRIQTAFQNTKAIWNNAKISIGTQFGFYKPAGGNSNGGSAGTQRTSP